jgi:CheY-like chemotaxis protein
MTAQPRARRILVIDDQQDIAESFARMLQLMGHEVEFTTDPVTALPAARRFKPELVFLDLGMPLMDGYELARLFRSVFGYEQMRMVALTAYNSQDHRARSREAGFDAHIAKPADPALLEAIVKTIFDSPRS